MKYVSVSCRSSSAEAVMTPDNPPMTNVAMMPTTHSSGVSKRGRPLHSVAIQQKICMPAANAIAMLAAV